MTSLKLDFTAGGAELKFGEKIEDFDATIQAGLVNFGTNQGSDATFPARGTRLLREAVSGKLVSGQAAQHSVNFAAVETLFFVRATEPVDSGEKIVEIITEPITLDINRMQLRLQFRGTKGTVKGIVNDLVTDG